MVVGFVSSFFIKDDKRPELFVHIGYAMGSKPTPTILISLATLLWVDNTDQIPDSNKDKDIGIRE